MMPRATSLPAYLADTVKARIQQPDGTYERAMPSKDGQAFSAQDFLMKLAEGKVDMSAIPKVKFLNPPAKRARTRRAAPQPAHAAD